MSPRRPERGNTWPVDGTRNKILSQTRRYCYCVFIGFTVEIRQGGFKLGSHRQRIPVEKDAVGGPVAWFLTKLRAQSRRKLRHRSRDRIQNANPLLPAIHEKISAEIFCRKHRRHRLIKKSARDRRAGRWIGGVRVGENRRREASAGNVSHQVGRPAFIFILARTRERGRCARAYDSLGDAVRFPRRRDISETPPQVSHLRA